MTIAKAIVGGVTAAVGVLATGAVTDGLSLAEILGAAFSGLSTFGVVWGVPNTRPLPPPAPPAQED